MTTCARMFAFSSNNRSKESPDSRSRLGVLDWDLSTEVKRSSVLTMVKLCYNTRMLSSLLDTLSATQLNVHCLISRKRLEIQCCWLWSCRCCARSRWINKYKQDNQVNKLVTPTTYKNACRNFANLGWLWTERYPGCGWPVARLSEIMCACWWQTLWTHAVKLLFICIMWFIRTFYETVNGIRCIWRLFRS